MLLKGNSVLKNRVESFIKAGDESFKKMGTVKTKFLQDLLEIGGAYPDRRTWSGCAIRARISPRHGAGRGRARVDGLHRCSRG